MAKIEGLAVISVAALVGYVLLKLRDFKMPDFGGLSLPAFPDFTFNLGGTDWQREQERIQGSAINVFNYPAIWSDPVPLSIQEGQNKPLSGGITYDTYSDILRQDRVAVIPGGGVGGGYTTRAVEIGGTDVIAYQSMRPDPSRPGGTIQEAAARSGGSGTDWQGVIKPAPSLPAEARVPGGSIADKWGSMQK